MQQNTLLWIIFGIIFIIILTRPKTEKFDDSTRSFATTLANFMQTTKPTYSQYLLHLGEIKNTHISIVDENVYESLVSLAKITSDDILKYLK